MKFIDEIRGMKKEYVLNEELKNKIRKVAKDKNYILIPMSELSEDDIKALEKEGFVVSTHTNKELDCKNEYYDREYYKITW